MGTALKTLAQAIKLEADKKSLTELFEHTYYKTVKASNPPRVPKKDMFSPSSLNKCSREIYYRIHETPPEPNTTPILLLGSWTAITNTGTDRHERIQNSITQMYAHGMNITWVDVGRYVFEVKPEGTKVVERQGMETKLYSSILSARFLCDGIVIINGKYYLIEIKTMNDRKWSKAKQSGTILPDHIEQGIAYSIATGINNILYIYENRNNSQIAVYEKFITPENKRVLLQKITNIQEYKKLGKVPPKTTDIKKCTYCEYKNKCIVDGYTPDLFKGKNE